MREEIREGVEAESAGGHIPEFQVAVGEEGGYAVGETEACRADNECRKRKQHYAFPPETAQFRPVAGTVVEADDRRYAHRIAEEHSQEKVGDITDHAIGIHSILPCQQEKTLVVEHTHQRNGEVGDKFRHSVGAGLEEGAHIRGRASQTQQTVVAAQEIYHRQREAYDLTEHGRSGGSPDPPAEDAYEKPVEEHIRQPGCDGKPEPQARPFGCHHKWLEDALQHKGRHGGHYDIAVLHGIFQQLAVGSHEPCDRTHQTEPQDVQEKADDNSGIDHHRKIFVGQLWLAFSQSLGNQGGAS